MFFHVPYLWLTDPALVTLETDRLGSEIWTLTGTCKDGGKVSAGPFEAIEIDLGSLWRTST